MLIVLIATIVGCGGNKSTYAKVKGTVTLNGKPLDKGEIAFTLVGKPPTFMNVVDGKFSGQAIVGSNTISISAKRKSGVAPKLPKEAMAQMKAYREKGVSQGGADPNANFDSTMIDLIPQEWGASSKQVRVVELGAANDFEFDISTKK
jgi:hypothetical protein